MDLLSLLSLAPLAAPLGSKRISSGGVQIAQPLWRRTARLSGSIVAVEVPRTKDALSPFRQDQFDWLDP
jgi:hypothetical protein